MAINFSEDVLICVPNLPEDFWLACNDFRYGTDSTMHKANILLVKCEKAEEIVSALQHCKDSLEKLPDSKQVIDAYKAYFDRLLTQIKQNVFDHTPAVKKEWFSMFEPIRQHWKLSEISAKNCLLLSGLDACSARSLSSFNG